MRRWWWLWLWWPSLCWGSAWQYRIKAEVQAAAPQLVGTVEVRGQVPLTPTWTWIFGPERFGTPPSVGGELLLRRLYPHGFDETSLQVEPVPPAGNENSHLAHDLPRGDLAFRLTLPERFGSFTRYRGRLTLSGGWYPYLAAWNGDVFEPGLVPAPTEVEVVLKVPRGWEVWLSGQHLPCENEGNTRICEGKVLSSVGPSLVMGPGLEAVQTTQGSISLVDPARRRPASRILALAEGVAGLWSRWTHQPPRSQVLVTAPLRRFLTAEGEGVVFVSDRALDVSAGMIHLHEPGLVTAFLRERLGVALQAEGEEHRRWLADGVGWWLSHRVLDELHHRVTDVGRVLRPVAFLPAFDQLLYAPRFPFSEEIYGSPFLLDVMAEDQRDVHHPQPPGRVVMVKLRDRYGIEGVEGGVQAVLAGRSFFEGMSQAVVEAGPWPGGPASGEGLTREEIEAFARSWLRPVPRQNLKVEGGRGRRQGVVLLAREVEGEAPPEAISVRRGEGVGVVVAPAMAAGVEKEVLEVELPPSSGRVEVDPLQSVLELSPGGLVLRGDNTSPQDWKLLFGAAGQSLSLSDGQAEFAASLSLMPRYDRRYLVSTEVWADDHTLVGVGMSAFRYFGPARDAVWRRQRVGVNTGVAMWRGEGAPLAQSVGVSYRYESREDLFDPGHGARLAGHAQVGRVEVEEGWSGFAALSLFGVKVWSPVETVTVVSSGRWDVAGGGVVTELYPLGGDGGVRGIDPDVAQSSHRELAGLELRYSPSRDLSIPLGFTWIRALQLVPFGEVGRVGESWGGGGGLGLRVQVDNLGIQPGLFGIDAAWGSVAGGLAVPTPRVYVRFVQAF